MKLHSYPKVYNLGHPAIAALFDGAVVVQEKVDGSQFSFGVVDGELFCRSKGADIYLNTSDKNFRAAVDTAMRLHGAGLLAEGWTYRGEALSKPKHNTAAYERTPAGNVILFDVDTAQERRVDDPEMLLRIADALGMEAVPSFYSGRVSSADELRALLETPSCLGGCVIEGIVIKNYARWGEDGKMLMGKWVREQFKEDNKSDWRKRNPTRADIVEAVIEYYRNERRWEKAVERLRDNGRLDSSPRDIGALMKELPQDVRDECEHEIKDRLFAHFWPQIARGITRGLPEWYKNRLLESQVFDTDGAA